MGTCFLTTPVHNQVESVSLEDMEKGDHKHSEHEEEIEERNDTAHLIVNKTEVVSNIADLKRSNLPSPDLDSTEVDSGIDEGKDTGDMQFMIEEGLEAIAEEVERQSIDGV